MINTSSIKKHILDLAFKGKLVKCELTDNSVDEYLLLARQEKEKIVKKYKGKKRPLILSIGDVPHELPANWKWVRLGEITEIFGRIGFRGYTKADIVPQGQGAISLSPSNIIDNKLLYENLTYISWEKYNESPEIMVNEGDVILCKTASIGKVARVINLKEKATINPQLVVFKDVQCDLDYLLFCLQSPLSQKQMLDFTVGTSVPTFTQEKLANLLIPLPSLQAQKLIAKQIGLLFAELERISFEQNRIKNLKVVLKNKILESAIKGLLVEQHSEEGTGEDLFKAISKAKNGCTRKEKELPKINENETPFEIPNSWKWVYIGDIFAHNTGKALNSSDIEGKRLEYITTSNVYSDHFELDNLKTMLFKDSEIEKCTIRKGDLLVLEGGDIGRAAIWDKDYEMRIQNHIHKLRPYSEISIKFYYYVLCIYKNKNLINGNGIGLQGLSSNKLHSIVVPLPPLREQYRIVDKIEKAFLECEKMI